MQGVRWMKFHNSDGSRTHPTAGLQDCNSGPREANELANVDRTSRALFHKLPANSDGQSLRWSSGAAPDDTPSAPALFGVRGPVAREVGPRPPSGRAGQAGRAASWWQRRETSGDGASARAVGRGEIATRRGYDVQPYDACAQAAACISAA